MAHWDEDGIKLYEGVVDRDLAVVDLEDDGPMLQDEGNVRLAEAPDLPPVSTR